jgi:hypothetical protein
LFRALGGILGLSITTTTFNTYLKKHLVDTFGNIPTAAILTAVQRAKFLPTEQQLEVRTVLSEAYSVQMKILVGFAAAQVLVVGLVHSLCVVWKENGFTQYWANIAMKINLKAGGTNHTTDGVEQIL